METLAAQPPPRTEFGHLDHERRIRTDTTTWLAEVLNGNMRTSFEFSFDGQELYGEDGGALTPVFDDAIEAAQVIVQKNPNLLFELRRRLIERQELDDIKAMARGELYTDDGEPVNTIVVTSDFPAELMSPGPDVGGYNRNRRQTMARIITLEPNGSVRVTTQSLDQSNRQALEAVQRALGGQPQPGELLPQRMKLNLPPAWQAKLPDTITATYDESLSQRLGYKLYAGRRPVDDRNTYDFVCRQHDLIEWFTAVKLTDPAAAERLRYQVAATAQARYERYLSKQARSETKLGEVRADAFVSVEGIARGQNLVMEMEREGRHAARRGLTFSGCGDTLEANGSSTEDQLGLSGYGNKAEAAKSWHGGKIYKNAKCISCEKVKPQVGACHICKDCVEHPKNPKLGTVQGRTGDPKNAKINKESAQIFSLDAARKAKEKAKNKNNPE